MYQYSRLQIGLVLDLFVSQKLSGKGTEIQKYRAYLRQDLFVVYSIVWSESNLDSFLIGQRRKSIVGFVLSVTRGWDLFCFVFNCLMARLDTRLLCLCCWLKSLVVK